jgi:hypothetical protein
LYDYTVRVLFELIGELLWGAHISAVGEWCYIIFRIREKVLQYNGTSVESGESFADNECAYKPCRSKNEESHG